MKTKGYFKFKKWKFPIAGNGKLTKSDIKKVAKLKLAIESVITKRRHKK
jgi:hypothetical protein